VGTTVNGGGIEGSIDVDTWVLLVWIAFAIAAYTFVLIALARLADGRKRRVRVRAWAALVVASLLALAAGLGPAPLFVVLATWLIVTIVGRRSGQSSPDDEPPANEPPAALAQASTEELCDWWARSAKALDHAYLPSSIQTWVMLREEILAELTRRDPTGVEAWLNDQPAERDPRHYLHDLAP
jgi:hypothetical protein